LETWMDTIMYCAENFKIFSSVVNKGVCSVSVLFLIKLTQINLTRHMHFYAVALPTQFVWKIFITAWKIFHMRILRLKAGNVCRSSS
jgi:hypothetical protein